MIHAKMSFVSVVIPTYNRRDLLMDALVSLFNQSYPKDRYEIIVVDNSSTDGTGEMMSSLQKRSQGILRYFRKENEGPAAARNLGLMKAKGSIVAFTDSDCVADQDWLKNGVVKITDGVGIVQGKTLPDPDKQQRTLQQTMKVLSENSYYQTCNIFYRKEMIDSAGGFSSEFCGLNFFGNPKWGGEDTDLAWKVKKQGWMSVFADDAVVYHHVFPVSSLKDFFKSAHLDAIFTIAYNLKKHPEMRNFLLYRGVFKSKQRALFYIFMLSLLSGIFIHWVFFILCLPYVIKLLRISFHRRNIWSCHRGLALFCIIILVELIESILSICASLIYRSVIL